VTDGTGTGPGRADPANWEAIHALPVARWQPLLLRFAERWGLPSGPWERLPGGEDCAAFGLGPDLVIKVLRPDAVPERETELLELVRLPVPTPRLLRQGEVDGWTALALTRLPGMTLELAWPQMTEPERLTVLHALGRLMPALAAVPAPASTPRPDLVARAVERFGPGAKRLLDEAGPLGAPVFLHGDLTDDNTFGAKGAQGWHLSGVLDFGGSYVGPTLVEVVAPAIFLGRDRPERLRALLDGAGLRPGAARLAAANLLHPYANLARDVGLLGGQGDSVEALKAAWEGVLPGA
jgi:hygromycin-B 7''-O-kinase